MAASAGTATLVLSATTFIADRKHADQPAANNSSGLVPLPGAPGIDSLTSRRPSLVREAPSRPPVVWALAVYTTFSNWAMVELLAKRARERARLLLTHDGETVGDGEHHGLDPRVVRDEVVDLAQRLRVGVLSRFVDDSPAPQHVVEQDESAGTHPLQNFLVVSRVVRLVSVDECEVEGVRCGQRLQRLGGGGPLERYFVRDAGALPIAAPEAGPFFVDVAAQQLTVGGQCSGHAQRAVAGERADFDGGARADCSDEDSHEGALLGSDLHPADPAQFGGFSR